ncbi:tubulin-specific chaperone C [Phaeosphaeriaceae sp. PMI808]|nr:tubulin-specific chaperone C [Phaeosphaeriaceae sp. PMI808]
MAVPQAHSEVGLKENFFRTFQDEVTALQKQMEQLNAMSAGSERNDAIDHCLAGIDRLSHEVKDATGYIPAYDQRSYSQTIRSLAEKLQTIRNSFNPPKKFSFKTRKNAAAISTNPSFAPTSLDNSQLEGKRPQLAPEDIEEDGIENGPGIQRPLFPNAAKIVISNHSRLHLILPDIASHATSSGTVSKLQHCVVDLSAATAISPFSALYLKNISNSVIVCGQVAGAIHITDVQNSTLVISCRQFRMHGSKKVNIYLHAASRPIIEDCESVRFAPLPPAFETSEISQVVNQWDQVDDFKWLKAEPSPNFGVLVGSQRVKDEVWRERVLTGADGDLDDILKVVGVQ